MKAQLTVEVHIMQEGNCGQRFTLGDTYQVNVERLSAFALVLVKIHEALDAIVEELGQPSAAPRK